MSSDSFHTWLYHADDRDLDPLLQLITHAWGKTLPSPWDLHPGDLIWQRFMHPDKVGRWPERVRIWQDNAGALAGFAIYYLRTNDLIPLPHPDRMDDIALLAEMLEFGIACNQKFATEGSQSGPCLISATEGSQTAAAFQRLGCEPTDDAPMRLNARNLDTIPQPVLPTGFVIRPLLGPQEYAQRVDVHREAFHPSLFSIEGYERVRAAPLYDPELDLVCVAPDGTFVSYAIAWHDPLNLIGHFEPVGARAAFRGRGLTKAVMLAGLHRLHQRGATTAYVVCETSNPVACHLYDAAGFREVNRYLYFSPPARLF